MGYVSGLSGRRSFQMSGSTQHSCKASYVVGLETSRSPTSCCPSIIPACLCHLTCSLHHRSPSPPLHHPFQFLSFHHHSFDSDSSPRTLKPFVFVQFGLNTYVASLPSRMLPFVWFQCSRFPYCSTLLVSLPLITLIVRPYASALSSCTTPPFPFTFDLFPLTRHIFLHPRLSKSCAPCLSGLFVAYIVSRYSQQPFLVLYCGLRCI